MFPFVGNPYVHFLVSDLLLPNGVSFPILPQAKAFKVFPLNPLLMLLVALRVKRSSLSCSLLISYIYKQR